MRETTPPAAAPITSGDTFRACLATVLELPFAEVPRSRRDEDPVGWRTSRWLGGLGLGLAAVDDAASFSWAGPWIGWVRTPDSGEQRWAVVMYGVPSGVAFDPGGVTERPGWQLDGGHIVAALDIAQARPPLPEAPDSVGTLSGIHLAAEAGASVRSVASVRALADRGLEGDRHVTGAGTFPSGLPGSALTLIQAEVCESFTPPLEPDEHRRNLVTRGIDLNRLVGRRFLVGSVPCRGMRLCEPCTVISGYSSRPVLRPLVHRGGLRADVLEDGVVHVADTIRA